MVFAPKGRKIDLTRLAFHLLVSLSINEETMGKSPKNFARGGEGRGGGDYLLGCGRGYPFVIPNVDQISITNSSSSSLLNHFQPIQNASPSVRGI